MQRPAKLIRLIILMVAFAVASMSVHSQPIGAAGTPPATANPSSVPPTPKLTGSGPCAAAPAPHLQKGQPAYIAAQANPDMPGAYLKAKPTHAGPVLRYLPINTVVTVVDGPVCGVDKTNWWQVKLNDLTGWLTETSGQTYLLNPFTGTAPAPLPSTVAIAIPCVKTGDFSIPATPGSAVTTTRVVYATSDGSIQISDNGGVGRTLATFNPPPYGVDISSDGSAVLVATLNGLYWVSADDGTTVLLVDNVMLGLNEGVWVNRVTWLPNSPLVGIEIKDARENTISFQLWSLALDGSSPLFQADTGQQAENGVRKTPAGDAAVVVSANSFNFFPKNQNDDTPSLLDFTPKSGESGDARELTTPAVTWDTEGKGFYTYIPVSDNGSPDDPVAGRLWYVPLKGQPKEVAKLPGVKSGDYVIPSRDGKDYLIGHGVTWTMNDTSSNKVVQTLPKELKYLFDWTPDSKGVVYNVKTGETKFLGVDGSTTSQYAPDVSNLYEIKWLGDGTLMFVAQGNDGKLSFSTQKPGDAAKFMGIVNTEYSFTAIQLTNPPVKAFPPESCVTTPVNTPIPAGTKQAAGTPAATP